jgi:hypothetical protein
MPHNVSVHENISDQVPLEFLLNDQILFIAIERRLEKVISSRAARPHDIIFVSLETPRGRQVKRVCTNLMFFQKFPNRVRTLAKHNTSEPLSPEMIAKDLTLLYRLFEYNRLCF